MTCQNDKKTVDQARKVFRNAAKPLYNPGPNAMTFQDLRVLNDLADNCLGMLRCGMDPRRLMPDGEWIDALDAWADALPAPLTDEYRRLCARN